MSISPFSAPQFSHSDKILGASAEPTKEESAKSKLALENFETLTIRLPLEERNELIAKLEALPNQVTKIADVVGVVERGDLEKLSTDKDFDLYALQAVRKGKLTLEQFCTSMHIKCAFEEPDVNLQSFQAIPLFIGSSLNPQAFDVLARSNEVATLDIHYLPPEELATLLRSVIERTDIPASEKTFYIIEDTRTPYTAQDILDFQKHRDKLLEVKDLKVSHIVEHAQFSFLISCSDDNGKKYRILASETLLQAVLDVHYKDRALKRLPVISPSTAENLRDAQYQGKRDVAIPTSEYETPTTADGYNASKLDFMDHDWYHCWIASACPHEHRKIFLELSEVFESGEDKALSKTLQEKMLDLENHAYKFEASDAKTVSDGIKFWYTLNNLMYKSADAIDLHIVNLIKSDVYTTFCHYFEHKLANNSTLALGLQEVKQDIDDKRKDLLASTDTSDEQAVMQNAKLMQFLKHNYFLINLTKKYLR